MRALIVTNMYPTAARPALGSFVRDQVEALRRIDGIDVEVFSFSPGGGGAYARAATDLIRRHRHDRFDVVHAHFGLTAWPAFAARGKARAVTLHGTDLAHPRSRKITLAALPFLDLVAAVSEPLADQIPRWASGAGAPCCQSASTSVAFARSLAPRRERRSGSTRTAPTCCSRPTRAGWRSDTTVRGRSRATIPLLTLGEVEAAQVPLYVNAANAVLVPSAREGFGLAVLEALACDVPVLATPVGIHPAALAGIAGTYCAPFDDAAWRAALAPHLTTADPRIPGRARAEEFSTDRMAAEVVAAWRSLL